MRMTLHNRVAGSIGPVYQKVGTDITHTHQHMRGLASVKVLEKQIVLVSRQRDLCCICHDHLDPHSWSNRSPLVRGRRP